MEPTPPPNPEPGRAPMPGEPAAQGQQLTPEQMLAALQQKPPLLTRLWQIKGAMLLFFGMLLNFWAIYDEIGKLLIMPTAKNTAILAKHGLFVDSLVHDGEWWRHFTALLTPTGGIDLLICAWIFWSLGPMVERQLGTIRFLTLYLLAGAGGIALAEVFAPDSVRWSGPWVGLYVVFGALPGIVFAETFSIRKTLAHPGTRSCAFWVVLGLVFAYISEVEMEGRSGFYDWQAQLGGMGLGVLLGFVLNAITSRPPVGILGSLGLGSVVVGLIVASSLGMSVKADGSGGGKTTGPTRERDPDDPYIDSKDEALSAEEQLLDDTEAFLSRWGPLPMIMFQSSLPSNQELGQAEDYYERVTKLALGTNMIGDELEAIRIRLLILLANYDKAIQLAEQYVITQSSSPKSLALAGAACVAEGGSQLHEAADYLGQAVEGEGLAVEWPEAVFLLGYALDSLHEDVPAQARFKQFLRVGTADGQTHHPHRLPMIQYAEQRLGQ